MWFNKMYLRKIYHIIFSWKLIPCVLLKCRKNRLAYRQEDPHEPCQVQELGRSLYYCQVWVASRNRSQNPILGPICPKSSSKKQSCAQSLAYMSFGFVNRVKFNNWVGPSIIARSGWLPKIGRKIPILV